MNKKEFLKAVATKTATSITKTEQMFDAVLETITKALSKGDNITFVGFGTFKVVKRAARKGRNPKTGEAMKISARKVAKFTVGKKLKQAVDKK